MTNWRCMTFHDIVEWYWAAFTEVIMAAYNTSLEPFGSLYEKLAK